MSGSANPNLEDARATLEPARKKIKKPTTTPANEKISDCHGVLPHSSDTVLLERRGHRYSSFDAALAGQQLHGGLAIVGGCANEAMAQVRQRNLKAALDL